MPDQVAHAAHTSGQVIHWARWYDLFCRIIPFVRRSREKLVELAAPVADEHMLDVGCGTGALAIALKSRVGAGKVAGIDPSPEMIEFAKRKSAEANLDVGFQVAAIEALPFPDASFDLVTSSLMLHHLPDELKRKGLAEVRRVLKPSGRLMAMDFAAQSHSALGHLLSILGHPLGESTLTVLTPILKEAGFRAVEAIPTPHKSLSFIRAH